MRNKVSRNKMEQNSTEQIRKTVPIRNKNLRNTTEQKIIKVVRVPRNKPPIVPRQKATEQQPKKINVTVTVPYTKRGGEEIQIDHSWIDERNRKNEERWQKHQVTEKTYLRNIEKFKQLRDQLILAEANFKNQKS